MKYLKSFLKRIITVIAQYAGFLLFVAVEIVILPYFLWQATKGYELTLNFKFKDLFKEY